MATPIISWPVRDRLHFQADNVLRPTSVQPASARTGADAHQVEMVQAPLRRCGDCELDLNRDVMWALATCPRWGKPRHRVEIRCAAFVAKDGAR